MNGSWSSRTLKLEANELKIWSQISQPATTLDQQRVVVDLSYALADLVVPRILSEMGRRDFVVSHGLLGADEWRTALLEETKKAL